jgi:hypothetical protein
MRFLTVYSGAFKVPSQIWSQLQTVKIDGIRCEGASIQLPYWRHLAASISGSSISQFTLHLNFLSLSIEELTDFESVMHILSQTVRVASFSVMAGSDIYKEAFKIMQKSFKKLNSLEICDLSAWNRSWALQRNWSCISELQTLRICSSQLSFSLLTDFIAYASAVVNLTIHNCIPEDASEGIAFIGLEKSRTFDSLHIPNEYRYGLYSGSIVVFQY